jgi:phosphoribosylanthranilate isomerase
MAIEVKICGLKTAPAMTAALDARADFVGLVFFEKSPRHLTVATAAALAAQARGRARIVALTVDPDDALVDMVVRRVRPDMIQLHGNETPERCVELRRRHGVAIMKAVAVETAADVARAGAYRDAADLILFDAKSPRGAALPGGNGIPFDWRALEAVPDGVAWMLSGGLSPRNVGEAIRLTGARRVDVSSGVERAPGEKDPDAIRTFIEAARAAEPNLHSGG